VVPHIFASTDISGITGKPIHLKATPRDDNLICPKRTRYCDHTLHIFEGSFGNDDTKHDTDVDAESNSTTTYDSASSDSQLLEDQTGSSNESIVLTGSPELLHAWF
jgi:hypothetical protein